MKTNFSNLDEQTQKDLTDWLNLAVIDEDDEQLLADLHATGRFKAWDCPNCGDRVFLGEPDDWGDFQGVHQADYMSYPAVSSATRAWCDHCRCHHQGKIDKAERLAEEIFS